MKRALGLAAPLAAFFVAAPVAAYAQNAIMHDDSALRAGPGLEYPRVAYVPEDARVYIHGCLRGYSWCDVSWRGDRGWVEAGDLSYSWNNRYVIVEDWGPRIGLPVIAFSVQDYWTRYYRDRPWWSQRYTWFERDGGRRDRDGWRDRDRDRAGWDRQGRRDDRRDDWGDDRRGDWRDRQRSDQGDLRNRPRDDDDGRNRQRGDRDGARDRGDDRPRMQQGQGGGGSQREGGMNRPMERDGGRQGGGPAIGNRGGDNTPTGRIPQRQQGGGERM